MKKALIFASGNGSNFEAIVDYFKSKVEFELLVDKQNIGAIKRAQKLNVKYYYVKFAETYNFLKDKNYDLYILAGYMRILPKEVLNLGKFVNIHPSLLPKFKGLNAIEQAFSAKEKETGVTIHWVVPEVDSGEIIEQKKCTILADMTLDKLECKIHKIEHEIYPKTIERILNEI